MFHSMASNPTMLLMEVEIVCFVQNLNLSVWILRRKCKSCDRSDSDIIVALHLLNWCTHTNIFGQRQTSLCMCRLIFISLPLKRNTTNNNHQPAALWCSRRILVENRHWDNALNSGCLLIFGIHSWNSSVERAYEGFWTNSFSFDHTHSAQDFVYHWHNNYITKYYHLINHQTVTQFHAFDGYESKGECVSWNSLVVLLKLPHLNNCRR